MLAHFLLRFLEPAALRNALVVGCDLLRLVLGLRSRKGNDHAGNCQDGEQADKRKEGTSRRKLRVRANAPM